MYARFIQNARRVCQLVLGCARVLQVTGMINAGAADPVSAGFGTGFLLHPKICSEVDLTKKKKVRRQWPSSGGIGMQVVKRRSVERSCFCRFEKMCDQEHCSANNLCRVTSRRVAAPQQLYVRACQAYSRHKDGQRTARECRGTDIVCRDGHPIVF